MIKAVHVLLLIALVLFGIMGSVGARETSNYVVVIEIRGSIDYGIVELVKEGIERAESVNGILVMILDTPGGLVDAAQDIISLIRTSEVPVIGYVYPPGKGAWSAGTFILLATHIAVMAPGTVIGSMQPILYNPMTGGYEFVNESKLLNPIIEQATTLARDRGRNVSIARRFVTENLNLDAEEAYRYHIVEYIALSLNDLLAKINGVAVQLDNGEEVVIRTNNAVIDYYSGSLRSQIIHILSDPILNGILSTIGIMIVLFSIISGHYIATPIGVMLILLSLIGAGFSANLVSLALIFIGSLALAIELFVTPGFGVLGFSGIIMIALGIALMPFFTPGWLISPEYQRALFWVGVAFGITMGFITSIIVYKALKARRKPPMLKADMTGAIGKSIDKLEPGKEGFVFVDGEYWRARSLETIEPNEKVIVVGKEGPFLIVRKYIEEEAKA